VVDKLTYAGDLESLAPVANSPGYSFVRADIIDAAKMRDVIESFSAPIISRRSSSRSQSSKRSRERKSRCTEPA
jgi:dTDP-D-glucose 4,6-dehydratase